MREDVPDDQRLKRRADRFRIEGALVLKNRVSRGYFYLLKAFLFPFQFIEYLFYFFIYLMFREKSYSLLYFYQKRFFKSFFKGERIFPTEVYPIPSSFKEPTLIFTNRISPLLSPFLLTLFKFKVHVPVQDNLETFPLNFIFRFFTLGRFIYSFGYEDDQLSNQTDMIHQLLKTNRPVVSYFNKDFASQSAQEAIHIYSELIDFIRSDVQCYFLKLPYFEFQNITTFTNSHVVAVTMISKQALFEGIDLSNDEEIIQQLVFFFNFRYGRLI
tara:strand:- start:1275 stop:2087 length:813 start_codon:yes stop_codon:yes gene_type:complete